MHVAGQRSEPVTKCFLSKEPMYFVTASMTLNLTQ